MNVQKKHPCIERAKRWIEKSELEKDVEDDGKTGGITAILRAEGDG